MTERGGPMARWFAKWRGGAADGSQTGGDPGQEGRDEYWVDLATGAVERGRQSPGARRMGPYPTRQAAQHAFDTAASRNEAWDEADRRWNDDDWSDR